MADSMTISDDDTDTDELDDDFVGSADEDDQTADDDETEPEDDDEAAGKDDRAIEERLARARGLVGMAPEITSNEEEMTTDGESAGRP